MTITFVDIAGRTLPRKRFLDFLKERVQLTEEEIQLAELRCCDGLTQDQIEGGVGGKPFSIRQQKALFSTLAKKVDIYVRLCEEDEFKSFEKKAMSKAMTRYNILPIETFQNLEEQK